MYIRIKIKDLVFSIIRWNGDINNPQTILINQKYFLRILPSKEKRLRKVKSSEFEDSFIDLKFTIVG